MLQKAGNRTILGTKRAGEWMTFTFVSYGKENHIVLFDRLTKEIIHKIEVPDKYSVGYVYSISLSGVDWDSICYLYEIDSVYQMDSYAKSIVGREIWNDKSRCENHYQIYGGCEQEEYQWKHEPVFIKPEDMIMYKLHVRGFTMQHGLSKAYKGNYKGVIARLDYLKNMGITSVEMQPVYDFEEMMYEKQTLRDEKGKQQSVWKDLDKVNYWGYGHAQYFAPKASYFCGEYPQKKMKEMIDQIHGKGMEFIMEMSFSEETSKELMIQSILHWKSNYQVDGFHFVGCNIPIEEISNCPLLGKTKIFYEKIPVEILEKERKQKHLFVYNDDFQYELRKMQNHMGGSLRQLSDQWKRQNKHYGFVNYAANTSGFTLWDSYSYGEKNNWANGEENKDGINVNYSYNYGKEGKTNVKYVLHNRMCQMRNAFTSVILAQGVPLIRGGDELAITADGNNNPYCQDNEIGWSMYSKSKGKRQLQQFVTNLIAFRKSHKVLALPEAMKMNDYLHVGCPDLSYHGSEPWSMDIGGEQRGVGVLYCGAYGKENQEVYLCYNFHYDSITLALPRLSGNKRWMKVMNTTEEDTFDFVPRLAKQQQRAEIPGSSISIYIGMEEKEKRKVGAVK